MVLYVTSMGLTKASMDLYMSSLRYRIRIGAYLGKPMKRKE